MFSLRNHHQTHQTSHAVSKDEDWTPRPSIKFKLLNVLENIINIVLEVLNNDTLPITDTVPNMIMTEN